MQFTTAILALAATAFAAPNADNSARGYQCTFGQYACAKDGASIRQCNIAGNWVVSFSIYFTHYCPLPFF